MLCYCWQFEVYCSIPQLCNLLHSKYCILGVSLRDVGKRLPLPRMIIPLLQPCCRHMFVSGIGWRLNIFFSKKGWKFCVAVRMVFILVSLFKTPIDCYLWKRKNCLVTTAWRSFSFFHNSNRNIKWIHDIETHLQNLLAYKTQLLITLFNPILPRVFFFGILPRGEAKFALPMKSILKCVFD